MPQAASAALREASHAVSTQRKTSKLPAPPASRGRPRKYSDELLVDAALRVMGRDGYTALTIRSLAEELGVSHSALYTYVGAIEEIEDRAKRRLTDQLPRPQSSSPPELRKELLAFLQAARVLILLHPGVLISRLGSAASEIFRDISEQWFGALTPHAPDLKTVKLALTALMGTVLLIVEGERLLSAGIDRRGPRTSSRKASAKPLTSADVEPYLNDLIDLVLPGLATSKAHKPARRRSKQ